MMPDRSGTRLSVPFLCIQDCRNVRFLHAPYYPSIQDPSSLVHSLAARTLQPVCWNLFTILLPGTENNNIK